MQKRNILFGAVLCFAGGAIDGYSYVMRGGVLETAQTANLLLLGIHISGIQMSRKQERMVLVDATELDEGEQKKTNII